MMTPDFSHAQKCMTFFRKIGLCPLPSRMVEPKGPMLPTYADHYTGTPVPESVYDGWSTTNIQVITGTNSPTPTKVIVVDCDGDEAHTVWRRIKNANGFRGPMPTWISRTGGGGWHYWFLLPADTESCAGGMVWGLWDTWGDNGKGKWAKHKEVRILADNCLVVAPPSIHVTTGIPYEFLSGRSPKDFPLPAVAPEWLLKLPRLSAPRFGDPPKPAARPQQYVRSFGSSYTREDVLCAVGDRKFDIACREWGLAPAVSGPNPMGWCSCYVPGREDPRHSRPSGSFHFADGTFQDRKDLTSISFFDLAVSLGAFQTWQDARDSLGDRFLGKRKTEKRPVF